MGFPVCFFQRAARATPSGDESTVLHDAASVSAFGEGPVVIQAFDTHRFRMRLTFRHPSASSRFRG